MSISILLIKRYNLI